MKRKKQLLSWILSFLMVFSIMPIVSISALAYDIPTNDTYNVTVYPGEVLRDKNDYIYGIRIWYYSNDDDYMDNPAIEFNEDDASNGHTIASPQEANLVVPDGYVLDNYIMRFATSSGGERTQVHLVAQWKKVHKITYDMTHITTSQDINVDGEEYDIDGQTCVTSGSAVTITIAAEEGYRLPNTIGVEMGGNVLEDSDYDYDQATGEIEIDEITDDVEITAAGVKLPSATIDVSDVTKTSAALSSIITQGDEEIIDQGFDWKKTDGGTYTKVVGTLNGGILTGNLTGLSENTSYTVRPFIVTESETYYGDEQVFFTDYKSSSVTTKVSNVTKTSAVLSGTVTKGSEEIVGQGFEWKKTDGGSYVQKTGTLENGILTVNLTGLEKNTRYTVRPFVVTETDTYYGAESTFRTKKSTSSGSSSSSSSSGSSSSNSSKSDILIVEPTEEAIIKALKTSDYKKIELNLDKNPNLLLSKAIIDALTENKDKTLIVVSNGVSTNISINENNEMKFTRNGSVLTGFISVFNSEYYSDYNGIVQKGWVSFPGDNWYYVNKETGIIGKGWIKDNGNWYYLNQLGLMQTGWINDNGVWYYLDKSSGRMLSNTTIDGYVLGSSGAWIS